MNKLVVWVVWIDVEGRRARSKIALSEEVQRAVIVKEHPNPDIELALEDQERSFNVLLEDKAVMLEFIAVSVRLLCVWLVDLLA